MFNIHSIRHAAAQFNIHDNPNGYSCGINYPVVISPYQRILHVGIRREIKLLLITVHNYQGAIMAQMLQHSWLKCYYIIAVIKLTKATSHFPLETQPLIVARHIACSLTLPQIQLSSHRPNCSDTIINNAN